MINDSLVNSPSTPSGKKTIKTNKTTPINTENTIAFFRVSKIRWNFSAPKL